MSKEFGKGKVLYESKGFKAAEAKHNAKKVALDKVKKDVVANRVLPGHKRRTTEISHEKDDRGTVVSFKRSNYLRNK